MILTKTSVSKPRSENKFKSLLASQNPMSARSTLIEISMYGPRYSTPGSYNSFDLVSSTK